MLQGRKGGKVERRGEGVETKGGPVNITCHQALQDFPWLPGREDWNSALQKPDSRPEFEFSAHWR